MKNKCSTEQYSAYDTYKHYLTLLTFLKIYLSLENLTQDSPFDSKYVNILLCANMIREMSTTRLKLYFKKPMLYQKGINTTLSEPNVWPIALSCASWSVAVVILGYSISLFTTWLKNIWNAYLQFVVCYHQKRDYIRKQVFVTKYFCLWSFDFDRGSYDITALVYNAGHFR